ncbi:MAG TPA: VTT domain-containing protein [Microbacterium sp.]|uniref:DedA family protein n=1 Tax=Microbacterium sp. TaxID=51671 RepID=UPI002C7C0968|nr:VTT domain-containing protein [Microbacterium sp.]HWI31140.1 VTT domain-containing protein [Microbacterium sp.]
MIEDAFGDLASGVWALPALFALVFGDAFLVVVPGEAAVTAFAALSVVHGQPALPAVVVVAAVAAFAGDATCYAFGRSVGLDRWAWARHPRVLALRSWAHDRLQRSTAAIVFTARFIPFARIAVNLTAGAERVPAPRYLGMSALAALAWACYQSFIGAAIARLLPDAPVAAVVISIAVALAMGWGLDVALTRRLRPPG